MNTATGMSAGPPHTAASAGPAGVETAGSFAAPPGRAGGRRVGFVDGVRHGLILAWRNMIKGWRTPEQLFDVTLQPIVFVLLFVFFFGGAVAGDWHRYLRYVIPGIMVQTVLMASMYTGMTLNSDLATGVFDRFRSLPIARSAALVGAVLGDFVRYVVAAVFVVGFGMILGFRIHTNPLAAVAAGGLVIAMALALSCVSALVGML
ncbi:ABC transporter permease, partial [Frankia sp. Cppng1_Ct_nod]|uniref:ABC transporter permease n=1 Tax=Frankia sp. Cppng1_Ct_nod TaxID=2897162 RepID=UPI002024DC67